MSQFIQPPWQVISVGLLIKKGKVLLGLRPVKDSKKGNVWEFPGGSVEWGENPQTTVIRELREELDIQVRQSEIAGCLCDHQENASRLIVFFYIKNWDGKIQKLFHERLSWFSLEDCVKKKVPNINPQLFEKIMALIRHNINE